MFVNSPWVQRNLDFAQFAQPRGSEYAGASSIISLHSWQACDGGCGRVLFGYGLCETCEQGMKAAHTAVCPGATFLSEENQWEPCPVHGIGATCNDAIETALDDYLAS